MGENENEKRMRKYCRWEEMRMRKVGGNTVDGRKGE